MRHRAGAAALKLEIIAGAAAALVLGSTATAQPRPASVCEIGSYRVTIWNLDQKQQIAAGLTVDGVSMGRQPLPPGRHMVVDAPGKARQISVDVGVQTAPGAEQRLSADVIAAGAAASKSVTPSYCPQGQPIVMITTASLRSDAQGYRLIADAYPWPGSSSGAR